MANPSPVIETVVGADVSRDSVILFDLPSGRTLSVANERQALRAAFLPLRGRQLVVCEATGGYEALLLEVLTSLAIPAHRGDGGKINAFARSFHLGKSDRLDARTLAHYGRERGAQLARWNPAPEYEAELAALVRRRHNLVGLRKAERARAKAPGAARVAPSIARSLAFLDAEIRGLEHDIARLIEHTPQLRQRRAVLATLPGVGPTVAANLLALLPELGRLTRRRAAALAAVAPHPRDSGTIRRHRRTTGGRRELRPILFIAALTASQCKGPLQDCYRRLLANGKSKRLALVALMRKIVVIANARLAQDKPAN